MEIGDDEIKWYDLIFDYQDRKLICNAMLKNRDGSDEMCIRLIRK